MDYVASHYRILCELGAGGMGVVFKAFDTRLERIVALKFLTHTTSDSHERDRLLREARAASNLDHENIAAIHSVEETEDGRLFLDMAYYEGENLADRMASGPVSTGEALNIVRGIARGLEHAHRHNIVHRDIKPSNVILTTEGVPKIIDFGIAHFVSPDALTQSVNVAGTLSYMSPEQIGGGAADSRCDIWALGVITYELLAGRPPFPIDNPAATIEGILHEEPDLTRVPNHLRRIVGRALNKDPKLRYQSAADLVLDLVEIEVSSAEATERMLSNVVTMPHVVTSARKRPRRVLRSRTLMIVAFLAALTATYFFFHRKQSVSQPSQLQATVKPAAYETYLRGAELMQRYDKHGNLDSAIATFQSATNDDPGFALAWADLGHAYWIKYQWTEDPKWVVLAKTAAQRAAQLNGQLSAVYVTLGAIHGGTGQRDLAIQELQRALQLDGSNADALLGLADVYAAVGRTQEAETAYKRAIAMRPEDWIGPNRLGRFYFDQRRYADAAVQFRRVLELVPDHGLAHGSLGVSLQNLGDVRGAESEYKQDIARSPNYASYTNLGVNYYNQRRFADAAAMMEHALKLNDKDYMLWDNLAYCYDWLGRQGEVARARARQLVLLEDLVRIKPQDASVHADIGIVYAQQHLRGKAVAHLDAAAALSPEDPAILEKLGEGYEYLGERSKAIGYINAALRKGFSRTDLELTPNLQALLADPTATATFAKTSTSH